MKSQKDKALSYFNEQALNNSFLEYNIDTAEYIFQDIKNKLDLVKDTSLLDIGCGYTRVTDLFFQYIEQNNIDYTGIDSEEIIDRIQQNYPNFRGNLVKGYFPENHPSKTAIYDTILLYGMLHYVPEPFLLIQEAIKHLAPYGKILIGDIPNVYRKGRFLSSEFGRNFDAKYKGINLNDQPVYHDSADFIKKQKENNIDFDDSLNDHFIAKLFSTYTALGYDVYVLPQPVELPFSYTRQDVMIVKYD